MTHATQTAAARLTAGLLIVAFVALFAVSAMNTVRGTMQARQAHTEQVLNSMESK